MSTRNITFSPDEFYHLYSRGVEKRPIFIDIEDKKRFIRLLFVCNGNNPVVYKTIQGRPLDEIETGEKLVAIGAYCLMPNHFHLLAREINDGGIVKFMSKLLTAYSSYFNKKYERTGALFGSQFKSTHLDNDPYLKYIYSYIHLNPLKIFDSKWKEKNLDQVDIENFLSHYTFSSWNDYAGKDRKEGIILNKDVFPEYFTDSVGFRNNLLDWLNLEQKLT